MKTVPTILFTALLIAGTASAQVIYQYSADASDSNPTTQGWTKSGTSSATPAALTYQGENAWRIEDPDTTSSGIKYTRELNTAEIQTLQNRGYRIHARLALLGTDYNDDRTCYFTVGDGTRRYIIWFDETSEGDFQITLQTNGDNEVLNLGPEGIHSFHNIAIDVAPGGASASLLVDGETVFENWTGNSHDSQHIRFGNGSTSGRGAAAWNRVQIASRVPESDMTFSYLSGSDSYELDSVNNVAGHLHIPDTYNGKEVTVIGDQASSPNYNGILGLTSLRLPAHLKSIGNSAFSRCSGFTGSLTIPDGVTTINGNAFRDCSGLTGSLTIPDGVTSIGNFAFGFCSGFDSLTFAAGSQLQTIRNSAFEQCSGFTGTLTLPAQLQSIDDSAFAYCSGFTGSLTIPASVTSIDSWAFYLCSSLSEVCWLGAPPTTYNDNPFASTTATHYVLGQYLDDYRALEGLSGAQVKAITEAIMLTTSLSGTTLTVTYNSISGRSHQPQASTDLQSWSNHGTAQNGDGTEQSFTAPANSTHGYFRLQSQ